MQPLDMKAIPDFYDNDFTSKTLPQLVKHYKREALVDLERKNNWIHAFKAAEPDFKDAREKFFGPSIDIINALEEFGHLWRIALGNDCLTQRFDRIEEVEHATGMKIVTQRYFPNGKKYVKLIYDIHKATNTTKPFSQFDEASTDLTDRLLGLIRAEIGRENVSADERSFLEAAESAVRRKADIQRSSFEFFHAAKQAWTDAENPCAAFTSQPSPDDIGNMFLEAMADLQLVFENSLSISKPWKIFTKNLKNFTLHVGCPEAHDAPEENIKELRLLHSTQMLFFQKLQDDLQTQIALNKKQQEMITALAFRHLAEKLPKPFVAGAKKNKDPKGSEWSLKCIVKPHTATALWQTFWEDAIKTEQQYLAEGKDTHPLTKLHNSLSMRRAVEKSGRITQASCSAQRGHLYKVGMELFSTLSTNIHQYGASNEEYMVEDDQWGETCRGLLRALKPDPKNVNEDGEVDWEAERKRYLE